MTNGLRDIFLAGVRGKPAARPAVASVCQSATYAQMDILGARWPEANSDAEQMAKLALGARTLLEFDAVRVPFCQTIQEEILGCKVKYGDAENLPGIAGHPYDPTILEAPKFPENYLKLGRIPALIKAVELIKTELGNTAALIGGVIGPFSVTAELLGINDALKLTLKKPSALQPYLDVATRSGIELARAMVDAGADVICIEDMMASIDMISPKVFKSVVLPYVTRLVEAVSVPTILHICGKVNVIVADMIATGCSALSFEPKTDMSAARRAVEASGRKLGLIGGVDTVEHLFYGNAALVKEASVLAIKEGYTVLAPGCSIPPATATASLKAMVEVAYDVAVA